jgi:serine/threonine-protein kinase
MGEVYEARHVVVGRRFAVKFLHPQLAQGREAASRLLREAQAAGALDNPHLAAVLDFDTAPDGSPFLVMEYLSGESLATTLSREGPLPLPRALSILLQVCDGLDVAHRAGIIHRDLKPDNLFVTKRKDGSDLIKILDFGIAKLVEAGPDGRVTRSGAVLGTPYYMAPEQARGEKGIDFRVDIYAVGVVAYELLSGKKPHPGDGYNAILAHILTQPIAPLASLRPELPPALVRVIERALASDPSARPNSAVELAAALMPLSRPEVSMVDSHFDLRAVSSVSADAATLPAHDAAEASAGGTLESAIGDVNRPAPGPHGTRRTSWLALVAALAAASSWWLVKSGTSSAPAQQQASVTSAPSVAENPTDRAAVRAPVAPNTSPAPDAGSPSASVGAPTSARPAGSVSSKKTARTAAPAHSNAPHSESGFDEKNPY